MSTRFVSACLMTALVFAAPFTLAGAKPPDLPVNDDIECRDSGPQPVPITVSAPTPVRAAARLAPPGVLPSTAPPVPVTRAAQPTVTVAVPATPCAPCPTAAKMVTKVFTVADLVIPIDSAKGAKTTEDQLIKLITTTVSPESWEAKGGAGTLAYHPLTLSLAVNQPPHVHVQIADLLATLRHAQDTQVAVDVRFVCVPEEFWEKSEFNGKKSERAYEVKTCPESKKCGSAKADCSGVRFLNDIQVFQLMEAAQADMRTSVMQAPKVTMLNGQEGNIHACDQKFFTTNVRILYGPNGNPIFCPSNEPIDFGTELSLLPVVSADKRFVRVSVNATLTSQDSDIVPLIPIKLPLQVKDESGRSKPVEFTQYLQLPSFTTLNMDKTFTLPDGGSALLNMGKRVCERRESFDTPVLSKIPYINLLFKNVGYGRETERVLMLVTPRVIVEDSEETRVTKVDLPQPTAKVMPPADAEEQEEPPTTLKKGPACCEKCTQCCQKKCQDCCEKCASCCQKACQDCCEKCPQCCQTRAAAIVEKYQRACSEGHGDEAIKLAVQALAIDPMCFSKVRIVPSGKER